MGEFERQPFGPGLFSPKTVLCFRSYTPVYFSQRALPCEKIAAGDEHTISVYGSWISPIDFYTSLAVS